MSLRIVLLTPAVALALVSCAPGARMLSAPTFSLDPAASGLVRIDPPGVGDGAAAFRMTLVAENPNPYALRLTALEGDLFLQDVRAAAVSFRGGLELPAEAATRMVVDARVPLAAAPALLDAMASALSGGQLRYRVEAAVTTDVLGSTQRFPRFTLATGSLGSSLTLTAPSVALASAGLRVTGPSAVEVDVELNVTNPGAIGYVLSARQVVFQVGGQDAAIAALEALPVPSNGSATARLVFRFDPTTLGPTLAEQVRTAAGLAFTLRGGWALDAPGIASLELRPTTLLEASLQR